MADKKMTAADIHKLIKEKEVKYVDIRFTDPRGKWQHVTFDLMMASIFFTWVRPRVVDDCDCPVGNPYNKRASRASHDQP